MIDIIRQETNLMESRLQKLKSEKKPVVLFGAGDCGKSYYELMEQNHIEVLCFCDDDTSKQKRGFMGGGVISVSELSLMNGEFYILLSSYGPGKLIKRLKKVDQSLLKRVLHTDFYLYENGLNYYDFYLQHEKEIRNAYCLLRDEKSKKTFVNLLNYKISRDLALIEEIREDLDLQYFDPEVIQFSEGEVFLDLGAYNGDTVLRFCHEVKNKYKEIIALEPDKQNFDCLVKNTSNIKRLKVINKGTYSCATTLKFLEDSTWTSSIDKNGNKEIEVCTIDLLSMGHDITFIKADIEGAEQETILGAKTVIARDKPKLAFAVYHKKEDIFHLINMIYNINHEYKFYLRHYTENSIDTVLYAI